MQPPPPPSRDSDDNAGDDPGVVGNDEFADEGDRSRADAESGRAGGDMEAEDVVRFFKLDALLLNPFWTNVSLESSDFASISSSGHMTTSLS